MTSLVRDIPPAYIGASPNFGAKIDTAFISGMGNVNDNFVVLLNVDKVLPAGQISKLEQIAPDEQ